MKRKTRSSVVMLVSALAATVLFVAGGCGKESEPAAAQKTVPKKSPDAPGNVIVIRVDGMQRGAGGKTWMAWPESVKKALEGLKGVSKVEIDLEHDLFRVTLADKEAPTEETLFKAVRDLGYTPMLARGAEFTATSAATHPMGEMPEVVRKAVARAKAESKRFVLVDCMGDNWVACRKMSVKTFADPEVKKILDEHFVFVELNVDHEKEAAGWFSGKGIPDTWILSAEGKMLDRVVGFMEPRDFAARLRKILERR